MSKPSVSKSREALLEAFNELVVNRPYNAISVGQIVSRADVGRSTFYEHFRDKHDLLRHSMEWIIHCLASTVDENCDLNALAFLLDHFRSVGPVVLKFFQESGATHMAVMLAESLRDKLPTAATNAEVNGLPRAMLPQLIAETVLAQIRGWLNCVLDDGDAEGASAHAGEAAIARLVHQTARGMWPAR